MNKEFNLSDKGFKTVKKYRNGDEIHEFCLSDKWVHDPYMKTQVIALSDVKEFIRLLKRSIYMNKFGNPVIDREITKIINNLAGDKLV